MSGDGIATLLIAILGLVALIDYALIRLTAPLSDALAGPVDLRRILGWLFTPLAWLLGLAGFYYYGQTGAAGHLNARGRHQVSRVLPMGRGGV